MWFLVVIGIIFVLVGWIMSSGSIDLPNVDEKGLAGTLNQIGWWLIIIGVVITIILIALVLLGVGVGILLGMSS